MKTLLSILTFFLCFTSADAQYNRPYRITRNAANKSYLISNRGSGSIIQLDSNYSTSTVITGLTDPKDLALGTFNSQTGLLIIDNNKIVVYETGGYNKLITFNINPASKIEDIEFDLYNPGYFYLSDVDAGRILKGKVGPPPFYTPSYQVLASGLHRPKGLLFDSKGRLLVVTDSLNGQIIQIDTSNGNQTVLMNTGIDSLNHLSEDAQGNFYFTNWDDSYLYRVDGGFNNLTKLISFNKPAGTFVNSADDLLLVVCFLCNKLEFQRLHYFEATNELEGCGGDSVTVYLSPFADGIGSYQSGNAYLVEFSDGNGSFANAQTTGRVESTSRPDSIRCQIPTGYSGTTMVYRLRSTHPSIVSPSKKVTLYKTPDVSIHLDDTVHVCKGSAVTLAKGDSSNVQYTWSPNNNLTNSNGLFASFMATDSGWFQFQLKATNAQFGCSDSGFTVVEVSPNIKLNNWKRRKDVCKGDLTMLGTSATSFQFSWSPGSEFTDSTQPVVTFFAEKDQWYHVAIVDTSSGCTGADSVFVAVHAYPRLELLDTLFQSCAGDSISVGLANEPDRQVLKIVPSSGLNSDTINQPVFHSNTPGTYAYTIRATSDAGCISDTQFRVVNHPYPKINSFTGELDDAVLWYRFNLNQSSDVNVFVAYDNNPYISVHQWAGVTEMDTFIGGGGGTKHIYFTAAAEYGCSATSDTLHLSFVSARSIQSEVPIRILPNPSNGLFKLSGVIPNTEIQLVAMDGSSISRITLSTDLRIDLRHITPGTYILLVHHATGIDATRLVILPNSN